MASGANAGLATLGVNVAVQGMPQFNSAMQQIDQRGAQVAQNMNRIGSSLTMGAAMGVGIAAATTALSAMSRSAEAVGSAVIGLNSQLEQARIGFTAFTGSVEKSNVFIKQLQQFAATTTFEFPGLLQMSRQLIGMGVNAEAVIPMLKAVGATVMTMGGGEVEIKRVNRALTQMIATGRVQADEMNQLAEAGIPAWDMLAKSMGKSRGEVMALSKQGQISAQAMLQAFQDFTQNNNLDQVLQQSSQTWQAATSNIIDGLRNMAAEGFEPLFAMARDGAVAIANMLTSEPAYQFAADLKATMQDVVSSLQPVRDAVTRVWEAFKTEGVSGAFSQILTEVKNLATEMFGAGFNVVSEYASGIMQGATSLITEAANFVADTIASYLIGNSPPPVGPLSQIAQGGTAVIAAYVDGMRQGLSGIEGIAVEVQDALGKVDGAMTLSAGREALAAAGTDMKALQAASEQAEGSIRTIDDALKENQSTLRDYQNAATDIKDAYDAAIEPLQRQVEALKETNDLAQKQADLQSKLQLAQLKGQLLHAQGDPVQRAQLESRLDELQAAQTQLQLQERQLTLDTQGARLAAQARGETYKDTQNDQRKNALAQQRLGLERQEQAIRQQLAGMVDKEAVARIKSQQAQVQAVAAQRDINNEVDNLQRQLQAAPIEAQIKELQSQQQALLAPIQERIKETQREGQALQEQRQAWQGLKSDIGDVLAQQRQLASEAKTAAAEAAKAAKAAMMGQETDVGAVFGTQAIEEGAKRIGTSFASNMADAVKGALPGLIAGAIGGALGGAAFGPLGGIAGAVFGKAFLDRMTQHFGTMENLGGLIAGKLSDALNIDTGAASNAMEAFAIIFETVRDRALAALEELRTGIIGRLQGAQETLSGWQTAWQETFGSESLGAQSGINAIDGINKALQALQLLMEGDVKGAVDTLGQSFNQFGSAGQLGIAQLAQSFNDLNAAIQPFIPIAAGVAAAFVTFRTGLAIVAGVTALTSAWGALTGAVAASGGIIGGIIALLGGPVTVAVLAVAAVVGVLTAAWVGNWFGIQEATFAVIDAITNAYTTFTQWLPGATDAAMQTMSAAYTTGTETVQAIWETMTNLIPNLLTAMWNLITPENQTKLLELQTVTQEAWAAIQAIWDTVTATILATLTTWWESITTTTATQWEAITTYWSSGVEGLQQIWAKFWEGLMSATTTQFNALAKLWEGAQAILTPIAQSLGTSIMNALIGAINAMGGKLIDAVTGAVKGALGAAASMLSLGGGSNGATNMSYVSGGSKAGPSLQKIINEMAAKYALDAKLFTAQLQHESAGFDPRVISGERRGGAGEIGLGQFMPGTLAPALARNGITLQQYLGNAEVQVELAAQHMAELVKVFGDYDKALQAYNGGPGGVGSAATQRYAQIVRDVAATLQTQSSSGGSSAQLMSASASRMGMNVDQITAGRNAGLSMEEAQAICGPYAAVLFAQATGKNPSLAEAKELASAVGWTASAGMGGTGNFMSLLGRMGIQAVRQAATPENVNAALAAGNPIALSTPRHYFVGSGGTAQGGINVGATGSVMSRYGGSANMTLAEITAVGGGMNDLIVLTQKLETQGTQTFNSLTTVTGQFGDVMNAEVEGAAVDVQNVADTGAAANQALAASTQTLAASINSGVVPAGLAAREAIGGMAVGVQPLISAWANGEMSSNQLAESIVQLASQTGLATQPLDSFAQGNISVGEALRQVMSQLAQTDPAFAAIEQSMAGAQVSTEQLADVLLRGLSNVTGSVGPAMQQIAQSATPLQEAFATGAVSGDQFVASVVELAATSGLTQAPLRQMQDGVITANQALAQVVSSVAEANPALAEMATGFADQTAPATDAATAFLDWATNMQDAQAATEEQVQVIQLVPEAVADIAAPMQDASTTAMQTLPEATTIAMDATVSAISEMSGPAASAAADVGNAIVESLRSTVEAGAESIADAAKQIVEKALEAAKKAAEAVKDSVGDDGGSDEETEERAKGGRLNPGVWTLVGEQGPELISPSGYVYNARDTTGMLLNGINSGLFTLNKFASGGQSTLNSGGSGGGSGDAPKERFEAPITAAEYDLAQRILELTQKRSEEIVRQLPLEEAIRLAKRAQEQAARGTLEQQQAMAKLSLQSAQVDQKIAELRYRDTAQLESMYTLEHRLSVLKEAQYRASRGDRNTRQELIRLDGERLKNEQLIAQAQHGAAPLREQMAERQRQVDAAREGSLADQLRSNELQQWQLKTQHAINTLQIEASPLQREEQKLQREIQKILDGTVEQRAQIAALAKRSSEIDLAILKQQGQQLPIQKQIADLQKNIEAAHRGTLDVQQDEIRAESASAALRIKEIQITGKLRDIAAGTLKLSQTEINGLHEQLEVIENQKAQIQDQTELRQLHATVNTTDARLQVAALQEQDREHQHIIENLEYEQQQVQNQTGQITTQNQVSAAGMQERLTQVQGQLEVFTSQIAELEAQNQVLNLQVTNIQLANDIRATALSAEIIFLKDQVDQYDFMIGRIQGQNNLIAAQSALLTANNAVAAHGHAAAIDTLEQTIEMRQTELTHLEGEKGYLEGQLILTQSQLDVSKLMHETNLLSLMAQKEQQGMILEDINAQLGALNAQKQVYEDIRRLAEEIAGRPVTPPGAPPAPGTGSGGPPGTVVATATKNDEPTLYLSRGTGTDGWYTSDGRLMVQGGNANPPGGYRTRWLAEGGLWRRGEVAVLGEEGPEIAVAARDMHVFPHEKSEAIARAFGRASTHRSGGVEEEVRNVTVNLEYHRHGGTDYGQGTLPQIMREAVNAALRS